MFQLIIDRRGFQIINGFRQLPGKAANQGASLAQGIPQDTAESVSYLLQKQAGSSLASALKASEQRLSALLHDRSRIGRELHDTVLQALYANGLSLAQSHELRRDAPPTLPSANGYATDQLNKMIQDIRRMILSVESDKVD